jgi:para-aminobenzoate synthetase/4-amino-4-deoxychorismate lyase
VNGTATLAGDRWSVGPRRFSNPVRVIEATEIDQVVPALQEAEEAAGAGSWALGFVSYQAAPAFGAKLAVPGSGGGEHVPLAWFGVYEEESDPPDPQQTFRLGAWAPGMSAAEHADLIEQIRQAIADGDSYQVNLTFPMRAQLDGDPAGLFEAMVGAQPRSFAASFDLGGTQILSVSPELFFVRHGSHVTARPMKGTAPRGRSSAEDLARADELRHSEKEQAGNMMIVDMLRNDLGRVAEVGSVQVPALFEVERYPTVWQMTSSITARLREDVALDGLFAAMFPSGSVTGAPKVSTMGLISELEQEPRGPYCGAIGYLAPGGELAEFSVAIRTGVVQDRVFSYHVGGGITYDSDAAAEYEECMWKALVVTEAREVPDLLETMQYDPEQGISLLGRHVARLAASAAYWGIPLEPASVGDALSAVGGQAALKVRLVLRASGEIEVGVEPMPIWDEPVGLRIWEGRVDQDDARWAHKLADRSQYPASEDEAVEVVLVNLDGDITETDRSNIMLRLDGRWLTPMVSDGCLPGVYRSRLLEDGEVDEARLSIDDLHRAEEIAVTNALRGWRKAVLIE